MKERPILFSAPMVRAILEGRKTQTRRVIPFPGTGAFVLQETSDGGWWPYVSMDGESSDDGTGNETPMNSRYGETGDRLWVKETFAAWYRSSVEYPLEYETITGNLADWAAAHGAGAIQIAYRADRDDDDGWRPSIFMPRWASRIALDIAELRVQQLQEISDEDAIAEGARIHENPLCRLGAGRYMYSYQPGEHTNWELDPRTAYKKLWDHINAKRGFGWDVNPWVWAVTFKRVEAAQ